MKRTLITSLLAVLFILVAPSVYAQSDTGNPVGVVDGVSCSSASGWSYDPDYVPPVVYGCTDSTATNFNINATNDNGSCTFPQPVCVSRYRWVNINAGTVDPTQGCAAVGATPVASSPNGICASGEDRPNSGYGVAQIDYSRGIWGSGNGGGGTVAPFQNGGYRCYQSGQRWDKDNTDVAVAYYCDFGSQYSDFCPADNPPPPPRSSGGSRSSGCFTAETQVTLAGGSTKAVSSLAAGDIVRGETSNNTVIEVRQVILGDRSLYSVNGSPAFVTAGHPFKTAKGWKSIDPAETVREGVDLAVTKLSLGDELITASGQKLVRSIRPESADPSMVLYNPILDGDHTYYANGFLVHNKMNQVLLNLIPKLFIDTLANLFRPLMASAASSDSNSVLIYEGTIDNGTLLATVPANQYRGDVNAVMGITGNHGFTWSVPQSLSDNNPHTLSFYGTNVDSAGKDSELNNSPVTIQCAPPVHVNSAPSSPSLSCPGNGSYTDTPLQVAFTSSDADGNGVRYLVDWDANGTTDQIVPSGSFASAGSQQSASRSWSTAGQKTVNVIAEDDQGAQSGTASCSFSLATLPPPPATPACSDGIDNDNDGKIDFPADPGCASSQGTDETDIVQPPVDVCPNIAGDQATVPAGMVVDGSGNCLTQADFCSAHPADPSCNGGNGGGNGPGTSNFCASNPADSTCIPGSSFCSANPSAPSCLVAFTITSDEGSLSPIQFLGSLTATSSSPATSSPRRMEVNPVSGFSDPVSLQVIGIQSRSNGAPLPAGVSVAYSFDGGGPTATLTWNSSFGRYVTSQGIGSVFTAGFTKAIPEAYNVTLRGTSVNNPSITSDYVITIDPSATNPLFREI